MATHEAAVQTKLLQHINAGWTTQAISAACALDLPDRLHGGARGVVELAAEAGADPQALRRLLRALVTIEVAEEVEPGTFGLGALGHLLRRDHSQGLRNWALLNGGPLWSRWSTLAAKVRERPAGEPLRSSASRFGRLDSDDREAALFHGAMAELSRRVGGSLAQNLHLPSAGLVVDVGGGSGELLCAVLAKHRGARGLLFDRPHALSHAPAVLERHAVADRCRLQAGDFFEQVPAGGDLYLLKSILHDWDDDHAVRLLERCGQAMGADVPLLVIERPMPDRLDSSPEHGALARSDLNMLVGLEGKERRLPEYRDLFGRAGLMLRHVEVLAAGFSAMQVVHAPSERRSPS